MSLSNLFVEIEAPEFALRFSTASGLSTLQRAIKADPTFACALEALAPNPVSICDRIDAIAEFSIDDRYENPNDIALSAYILLLEGLGEDILLTRAGLKIVNIPHLWWASRVAAKYCATSIKIINA